MSFIAKTINLGMKLSGIKKKYSLPCTSPSRGARVVQDTDSTTSARRLISVFTIVPLPTPDGPDTTNSLPFISFSLYVLYLFAYFFYLVFQRKPRASDGDVVTL